MAFINITEEVAELRKIAEDYKLCSNLSIFDFSTPRGWICPRCGIVLCPSFLMCNRCKPKTEEK
jgi:hypothetical protein